MAAKWFNSSDTNSMVASFIEGFKIVVGKFSRIDVKVRFEKWLEITLLWTTSATKWPFPNQSENSNESYHIYQLVQRIQEQPILKVRILIFFLQNFFVVFDLVKTCFFYWNFWDSRKFRFYCYEFLTKRKIKLSKKQDL